MLWSASIVRHGGFSVLQIDPSSGNNTFLGHLVWKGQPSGGSRALGTVPSNLICFRSTVGSGIGAAESRASV